MDDMIRRANHCGSWYSSDEKELRESFKSHIESTGSRVISVKAAICPHAGYTYSLKTNSYVYACIDVKNIKNVFILGPNHYISNRKCLLPKACKYETPLGFLRVNKKIVDEIIETAPPEMFGYIDHSDDEEEHSIEMQLPLLKYIIGDKDIQIVPIYVGSLGNQINRIKKICEPLEKYFLDESSLFLFSSDFCHFGSRFGFTQIQEIYNDMHLHKMIENMDRDAARIISSHDLIEFIKYMGYTKNTICGSEPIKMFLNLIKNHPQRIKTNLVHYSQSNHAKNVNDCSVSYAGFVSCI